jgi:hypothetical protein
MHLAHSSVFRRSEELSYSTDRNEHSPKPYLHTKESIQFVLKIPKDQLSYYYETVQSLPSYSAFEGIYTLVLPCFFSFLFFSFCFFFFFFFFLEKTILVSNICAINSQAQNEANSLQVSMSVRKPIGMIN